MARADKGRRDTATPFEPPPVRIPAPTPNERILNSASRLLRGFMPAPKEDGYCLQLVRQVIEDAFGMPSHQLYRDYVTEWVQPPGYDRAGGHWARDAERSLRNLGMSVAYSDRQPGDILFRHDTAASRKFPGTYIGHVGVLLWGDLVLENVNPRFRATTYSNGPTCVTPLHLAFPVVTTTIRFDPDKRVQRGKQEQV